MIAIIVRPSMHYCPKKLLQHATYLHIYMYVYAHMYMLIKWVHLCKNGVASSNSPYQSMCADTCVCLDNAIKKYIRNVCIQTRRLQLQISIRRLTLPGLPGWIEFDSISIIQITACKGISASSTFYADLEIAWKVNEDTMICFLGIYAYESFWDPVDMTVYGILENLL